jgi:predicted TIM-barrel fold metal-dependent hydrolase
MKWKEPLNGDRPKRDGRLYDRCDLVRFWPAAEKAHLPVMFLTTGQTSLFARIAERHPQLTLIIDHMGVSSETVKRKMVPATIAESAALAIIYEPSELTKSEIYAELLPMLNSRTVALLENDRLRRQLLALERSTGRGQRDRSTIRGAAVTTWRTRSPAPW